MRLIALLPSLLATLGVAASESPVPQPVPQVEANRAEPAKSRATFVAQRVSSRMVALNQPVRIEFTTIPRQVEGADVKAAVLHALELGSATRHWRLLGKPTVTEHDKTRTINVAYSLLPRDAGEFPLPQIALAWLSGDQIAEFGTVKIESVIQVGAESRDLPKEMRGVGGFEWGARLEEVRGRFAPEQIVAQADRTIAKPMAGLDLVFRGGELAEADLLAPGLSLEQAHDSFLNRWGSPQSEEHGDAPSLSWVLGWTQISAEPYAQPGENGDAPSSGIHLHLVREDIQSRLDQAKVRDRVFDALDGPSPAANSEPSKLDAQREFQRAKDEQPTSRGK